MANFEPAFILTMRYEGGYANNPNDRGGETYKGIARKINPNWSGWEIVDAVKTTAPASLNTALAANAELQQKIMNFYQANYWDVNQTGAINDQLIANQVFDTAVNCGTGMAAKFLQEAAGVTVDRQVGQQTLGAVNRVDPQTLYNQFVALRKQYYLDIIARDPSQKQFEGSWLSRMPNYTPAANVG